MVAGRHFSRRPAPARLWPHRRGGHRRRRREVRPDRHARLAEPFEFFRSARPGMAGRGGARHHRLGQLRRAWFHVLRGRDLSADDQTTERRALGLGFGPRRCSVEQRIEIRLRAAEAGTRGTACARLYLELPERARHPGGGHLFDARRAAGEPAQFAPAEVLFYRPGHHPHRRHRPEQGLSWGALPDRRACRMVHRRRLGGTLLDACPLAAATRQDRTGGRRCGRRRRSRQWFDESLPPTPRSI